MRWLRIIALAILALSAAYAKSRGTLLPRIPKLPLVLLEPRF